MPAPSQPSARATAVAAHLSNPRLAPYLTASNGNLKDALRLYQWNIDISGAAYEALHVFEVVFRNAIDTQLCRWNSAQRGPAGRSHSADWLMDPSRLLGRLAGNDITTAQRRARAALRTGRPGGRSPGHPDLLAQLTFGTWRYLLPDRDPGRQLLWSQATSAAFPHLAAPAGVLVTRVNGVYRLRNRVAHLEPLLRPGLVFQEYEAMRWVLASIDPVAEQWFVSRQRMSAVLRARP